MNRIITEAIAEEIIYLNEWGWRRETPARARLRRDIPEQGEESCKLSGCSL